jgi:SAM-dependent methyltransferase
MEQMGGFSAGWLALREPADHASRSLLLTRAIGGVLPSTGELRVLDLAAGTGSSLRYLSPHLRRPQHWLLVDHDEALLARASSDSYREGVSIETRQADLASLNAPALGRLFEDRALVTASALLDLVSDDWVRSLATRCREAGAAALFALSYDGLIRCSPGDAGDQLACELVNEHQRIDKGFGPALGPGAANSAERWLTSLGYHVQRDRSDWVVTPVLAELQRQLIDGWARAAVEIAPDRAAAIAAWRSRRLAHVASRRSELRVGHEDLAAWLPRGRGPGRTGPDAWGRVGVGSEEGQTLT